MKKGLAILSLMFSGAVLVAGGYGFYSLKGSLPALDKSVAAPAIHGRAT
jgi:hypothetical protein